MAVKLCKYGHFSEHGAQNKCLACSRERAKKRREDNTDHVNQVDRSYYAKTREHRREKARGYYRINVKRTMLENARRRARKDGYPCTITECDIIIPEFCPLLGTKLEVGGKLSSSPSLDKIVPALGYVPGNVWVVSWRANVLKSDATVHELKLLVTNLEKRVTPIRPELTIPWAITPPAKAGELPWTS